MKLVSQSLMLFSSFVAVFLWQASPLADFTVPAVGFLIFLYLILSKGKKGKEPDKKENQMTKEGVTIFILNTMILLLIFATGGLTSPLYFLLYFISFGIAFVLLPETVFVFIVGAVLLFLPVALEGEVARNLLQVGSLALISPLAYFFGKEYRARQAMQERTEEIAQSITEKAGDVLTNEEDVLTHEEKRELADIIKESQELKKEI